MPEAQQELKQASDPPPQAALPPPRREGPAAPGKLPRLGPWGPLNPEPKTQNPKLHRSLTVSARRRAFSQEPSRIVGSVPRRPGALARKRSEETKGEERILKALLGSKRPPRPQEGSPRVCEPKPTGPAPRAAAAVQSAMWRTWELLPGPSEKKREQIAAARTEAPPSYSLLLAMSSAAAPPPPP